MPDFDAIRRASTKAARDRYYARHRELERARRKAFYAQNRQEALNYAKKYRQEHFKQVSARQKARRNLSLRGKAS